MLRTNLFKTALASMLVVCSTAFYSCNSDGEGPGEEGTIPESAIIGKWEVSDGGNTRATGDAKYGSFEFTEDNRYIITQPTMISGEKVILIISGEYTPSLASDNNFTLKLSDFGIIKISIDSDRASITIDNVTYVAVKSKPVDLSENNKKLIGTWNIEFADAEGIFDRGKMMFTNSGTYLLETPSQDDPTVIEYANGTWSWATGNIITIEWTNYEYESITPIGPNGEKPSPEDTEIKVTAVQEKEDWTLTELTDSKFVLTITYVEEGYPDETVTLTGTKSK